MSGLINNKLLFVFMSSIFLYSIYVKVFSKLGQIEREEGLRSHKVKNGTITMGGILFLIIPLLFINYSKDNILLVITLVGFGILGFIDDLLIIIKKKNDGLSPSIKLIIEILLAGIIFYYYLSLEKSTVLNLYFFSFDLKWVFGLFILWFLTASSNAWNLLDGVDGLCSGCSLIIMLGLMNIALKKLEINVFMFLLILFIVVYVFWCFNLPKAFLFMGDVGSLSLGAFLCMCSIYLDCIFSFIIMAGLFIFDTLSVIIQVGYYKRTKKRIFKMAPFHHHLEACGFKEVYIDLLFYLIQSGLVFFSILIS